MAFSARLCQIRVAPAREGAIAGGRRPQNRAFGHRWRREVTGGPGLDSEVSSSSRRRRRATQGWQKRGSKMMIIKGNNQTWRGAGRLSQPGPCLGSAGQSRPGLGPCVRIGSPESARAFRLSGKRVTAAAYSPEPDSSRLRRRGPGPGRPTGMALSRIAHLGVRPGPAGVSGNGRLPSGPCPASGSPPARWRPGQPSLMMALSWVA